MTVFDLGEFLSGLTVLIAASGQSQRPKDIERARGKAWVVAINETWRLAPWANCLYACDAQWWRLRGPPETEFAGMRIVGKEAYPGCLSANVMPRHPNMIWERRRIGAGGNGGFQALNLVARLGARRVILTGVDCHGGHWHDDHPTELFSPTRKSMKGWIQSFEMAAPELERGGVEVINCSRNTALTCFPKAAIEDVI